MDGRTAVKHLRWRPKVSGCVLFLICLLYLVQYSDRVNIATAADAIRRDLQLSNTELGFAFSAFAYPYAIVQLFGGWLCLVVRCFVLLFCVCLVCVWSFLRGFVLVLEHGELLRVVLELGLS